MYDNRTNTSIGFGVLVALVGLIGVVLVFPINIMMGIIVWVVVSFGYGALTFFLVLMMGALMIAWSIKKRRAIAEAAGQSVEGFFVFAFRIFQRVWARFSEEQTPR